MSKIMYRQPRKSIILILLIVLTGIFIKHPIYAAQNKHKASLVLHYYNGKVFQKKVVRQGKKVKLPCIIPPRGYTFMGWSLKKSVSDPQYTAGQSVTVASDTDLYAVMFHRKQEEKVSDKTLKAKQISALKKYSQIIFVGDSRTVQIKRRVKAEKNVKFVAKIGGGLSYLRRSGYGQISKLLKKKRKSNRPTAIIVNLGINDLRNKRYYVSYYRRLARQLKNCKFFFMSVNPTNEKSMSKVKHYTRRDRDIRSFNRYLKKKLAGKYTYLDCYSYLLKNGYGTDWSFRVHDRGKDDGLHYTQKTSRRIFEFCLDQLIKGA